MKKSQPNFKNHSEGQNQSAEHQTLSDQSSFSDGSQICSDNSLLQIPAFSILEESQILRINTVKSPEQQLADQRVQHLNIQEDEFDNQEIQAFLYLHQVRKQKKKILKQKKVEKSQPIKEQILMLKQIAENQIQDRIDEIYHPQSMDSLKFIQAYTEMAVSNFNIVVQNVKYLIKTNESFTHNNKKFNSKLYESIKLQNQPKVYDLIKLTLGQIQNAVKKLSFQMNLGAKKEKKFKRQDDFAHNRLSPPKQIKINSQSKFINYAMWIYSLLALHQGWSSYKNFGELGEINYTIIHHFQKLTKLNQAQMKSLALLIILLVNVFEQRHLTKFLAATIQRAISQINLCQHQIN